MSIISGTANWLGDTDNKEKKKEPVKKEVVGMTPAKKEKAMESISKKLDTLKAECNILYQSSPTSELSTAMTLLNSFQFNIDKLKMRK